MLRFFSFLRALVILATVFFPLAGVCADESPDMKELLYNLRLKQEDVRDIYLKKRQEMAADFQEEMKDLRADGRGSEVIRAAIEDYQYQQRSLKAAYRKVMKDIQDKINALKLKDGGYSSDVSVIQLLKPKENTYCPPTLYERVLLNIRC